MGWSIGEFPGVNCKCLYELRNSTTAIGFLTTSTHGGFLKWWCPTTMGFPTKNDHFGVFWGYHHLRKHPHHILKQLSFFFCWFIHNHGPILSDLILCDLILCFCQVWFALRPATKKGQQPHQTPSARLQGWELKPTSSNMICIECRLAKTYPWCFTCFTKRIQTKCLDIHYVQGWILGPWFHMVLLLLCQYMNLWNIYYTGNKTHISCIWMLIWHTDKEEKYTNPYYTFMSPLLNACIHRSTSLDIEVE